MKKITCKGGKIKFKLGQEVKEYYATDIEIEATTGKIDETEVAEKKPKKKRRPKKTAVKVQKVDIDLQKDGTGGIRNDITSLNGETNE